MQLDLLRMLAGWVFSQDVGMLNQTKDLPAVQKMLATAKDILGYDLLECCNGITCLKTIYLAAHISAKVG